MEGIRAFEEKDISQVACLHSRVFGIASSPDIQNRYRTYFKSKFIEPVRKGALPSLVYESAGQVAGFIAVGTRSFVCGRTPVRAALSSQFVVDPEARSQLVAVALLRSFLAGPQDLSFTDEANEASRKLWERLGGSTAGLYSTHWLAPLRPAKLLWSKVASRLHRASLLAGPVIDLADSVAWRISGRLGFASRSDLELDDLDASALASILLRDLTSDVQLRPAYDSNSLERLLLDANRPNLGGKLHRVLLRSKQGQVAGWFLYYLSGRGIAEVLQLGYRENHHVKVAHHLFAHARLAGASALSGRLEPHLIKAISAQHCLLFRREHTMLVHSRDAQIANAIHFGKAFISRLDGEWCLQFH